MRQVVAALGLLAVAFGVTAMAQTTAKVDHTADDQALAKQREDIQTAYNNHDAKAYAGFFATDADMRSADGELVHGRPAIEKVYATAFAGRLKNAKITFQPSVTTRYLGATLALIDGAYDLTGVMGTDGKDLPPSKFLVTATEVKRNGTWQVLTMRTWPANAIPGPAPAAGRKTP